MQKGKAGAHAAQAVLIFVGGCLALAVLTMGGGTGFRGKVSRRHDLRRTRERVGTDLGDQ